MPDISLFIRRSAVAALSVAMAAVASAQSTADQPQVSADPYIGYAEETYMDMDFEPNIATPEVPPHLKSAVKSYVRTVARDLKQKSLNVELMREGEVIVVSIPTDDLFLPTDTLLADFSSRQLTKIKSMFRDPYMFKVVMTMNTDDTGSAEWRESLSLARLNSLYGWFIDEIDAGEASEDLILIPFSLDSAEPVTDNLTRDNRKRNRRVEFYFIPGPKLITNADSGKM
ncbi:MAG: hypothetical protein K2F71_01955 [Paramuribaculum sp.]|nr:hypothetical protein [Paramuribaculum sp.]